MAAVTALATLAEADAVIEGHGLRRNWGSSVSHWRALCQRRAGMTDAAGTPSRDGGRIACARRRVCAEGLHRACLRSIAVATRGRGRGSSGLRSHRPGDGQFIRDHAGRPRHRTFASARGNTLGAETVRRSSAARRSPVTDHSGPSNPIRHLAHASSDLPRRDRHLADAPYCSTVDPRARERSRWSSQMHCPEFAAEAIAQTH